MKKKYLLVSILSVFLFSYGNASTFFSGYAGGKASLSLDNTKQVSNPDFPEIINLKLQAFFASQFNFTQNAWSHLEFSIDTDNLVSETIFKKTPAEFQIDELSFVLRAPILSSTNYFSFYLGTYDPIGSDIFLQRYLNSEPIASKITDSWLGMANTILYPHWGVGMADIVRINNLPIAAGAYFYINHENNHGDENYYQPIIDFRFACLFRYITLDFSGGIGAPIISNPGNGYISAIDRINAHFGTTMLIGNRFTTSLFFQGGLYNLEFTETSFTPEDLYLLFEPRFNLGNIKAHLALFSLPQKTVKSLFYVDDSLGMNLNIFTDNLILFSKEYSTGCHFAIGLEDKNLIDIISESINGSMDTAAYTSALDIVVSPYISTYLFSGLLHLQGKIRPLRFTNWKNPISIDIGYKTQF